MRAASARRSRRRRQRSRTRCPQARPGAATVDPPAPSRARQPRCHRCKSEHRATACASGGCSTERAFGAVPRPIPAPPVAPASPQAVPAHQGAAAAPPRLQPAVRRRRPRRSSLRAARPRAGIRCRCPWPFRSAADVGPHRQRCGAIATAVARDGRRTRRPPTRPIRRGCRRRSARQHKVVNSERR